MAAGLPVTKDEINAQVGNLARSFFTVAAHVAQVQSYLAATPDADLLALGFAQGEIDNLKSAYTELANVVGIFNGTDTAIGLPHDHTIFARRLIGLGLF